MKTSDEQISAWIDGCLPEAEATAFRAALAADPSLAERVEHQRHNDEQLRAAFPVDNSISPELLARLGLAEPAAQPQAQVIDLATAREQRSAKPGGGSGKRWQFEGWRVAAQLLLVVGLGGIFMSQWVGGPATPGHEPAYRTLGSSTPTLPANGIVMFRAEVSTPEIHRLVDQAGARLVGGPTSVNAYRIAIRKDRRDDVLARLRALPQVQMAEPIDGEKR